MNQELQSDTRNDQSPRKLQFLGAISVSIILFLYGYYYLSCFGIGLFVFFAFELFINLGQKIEIRDCFVIMALIQWVFAPFLAYIFLSKTSYYAMSVNETEYMNYVIPGITLFIAGLYFPFYYSTKIDKQHLRDSIKKMLYMYPNLDIVLVTIGLTASFLSGLLPYSLRFLVFLLDQIEFIGLFFILLSKRRYKWIYILVIFGSMFVSSVTAGMFHNFILWVLFAMLFVSVIMGFNYRKNLICLMLLLFSVFSIMIVKQELRKFIWNKRNIENPTLLFGNLIIDKYTGDDELIDEDSKDMLITRLNQGWIIAAVMNYVPKNEPFANGETVYRSIKDSLVPRFLNPNKLKVGGDEYFARFTGRHLNSGTSMDLSAIGEFYANYGKSGIYYMFLYGLFYNFILLIVFRVAKKNIAIILWLPLLFFYSVKAETGLYMPLNHVVKTSIFIIFFIWGIKSLYMFILPNHKDTV
jgi:hypothetical protein